MNYFYAGCAAWAILCCTTDASGAASEPPSEMTTECVGRMQLSLPKDFDVAVNSTETLIKEFSHPSPLAKFEFSDAEDAGYSIQYYTGRILISGILDYAGKKKVLDSAKAEIIDTKARVKKLKHNSDGQLLNYESLSTAPFSGFANRVNASFQMVILVENYALSIVTESTKNDNWSESERVYRELLAGIKFRAFGVSPQEQGICLPNIFIKDDGKVARVIGATYRLKAHPDITIWLEDSSSAELEPGMDPKKFTADHDNEFFWGGRYQDFSKGHLMWFEPHEVKLNGVKGVSTFMELTRQDGKIDYGFFAASRGNQKDERPTDLKMYVIRDSKNAISKGIKPMDKDDFIKLAETIAASVKQRPTDAH